MPETSIWPFTWMSNVLSRFIRPAPRAQSSDWVVWRNVLPLTVTFCCPLLHPVVLSAPVSRSDFTTMLWLALELLTRGASVLAALATSVAPPATIGAAKLVPAMSAE